MTAVALRGLLSRKLRTLLTMIAIVLGVAMIAGTFVLTDGINTAFSQIFTQADRSLDAVVSGKQVVKSDFSQPPALPGRLLKIVQQTPGVAAAEGEIGDQGQLYDLHGKQIGGAGGAPTLLFSMSEPRFRRLTIIQGHEPHGRELAIDKGTFDSKHLHLGQTVLLAAAHHAERFTIAGVTKFAGVNSLGGASLVSMDLTTAQRITDKVGKYDQIAVAAKPGVSQKQLVRNIKANIPADLRKITDVKTQEQNTNDQVSSIVNGLSFLTVLLLAFGGIAVFVGAFIIFNTFSITVAQRAREFALLRTLGATRSQVLRSVVIEALLIGIASSIIGLFAGIGIAQGLSALFKGFGVDLPNAGLIVATRTVVVALLVGTIITLLSSLMPALRATRVPPIAALREGAELPRGRFARFTPYIAAFLALVGIVVLGIGVLASISDTQQRLILIGIGALLFFLGIAMLSPKLVPPIAAAIGWPIQRFTRITGRLARDNAVRNPGRTATTAAALMIGLALVGFVTILAAEFSQSFNSAVNREMAGNFLVSNQSFTLIPHDAASVIARVPGVQTVSPVEGDNARVAGMGKTTANGIQPSTFLATYHFQWTHGNDSAVTNMGPHDAMVTKSFANDHHLTIGSALRVTTTTGHVDHFTVRGIFKDSQLLNTLIVRYDVFARDWQATRDQVILVNAAPGQNLKTVQTRIEHVLKAQFPNAQVQSQQQVKDQVSQQVNQLLAMIYILLAMSVIVSLFGIINTLVLSVYERTREIGMLRAIGTTRSQVRWMIRWESVITSVIGAVLGLVLGLILAVVVTSGLSSQGIEYAFPIPSLLIWVVFAIFFGIVAAAFPARRAARLDVLQAVAYE